MVKTKLIRIKNIKSKLISGKFGDQKYYGYGDKKIISLVKITLNNGNYGFGESLVGIYSPKLFELNLNYLSKYFVGKTISEGFEELKKLQYNKFFFYQGIIKSILSAIEIALISNHSQINKCTFADSIAKTFIKSSIKKENSVEIYASAGSIKSSLKNLKKDFIKAKDLKINRIKIRLDINRNYKKILDNVEKYFENYAVDLIANTFRRNNNFSKLNQFLTYIKNKRLLWLEEPTNIENIFEKSIFYGKSKINISIGENFTSYYDFLSLLNVKHIKYVNIDLSHCSISDIIKIIKYIQKNKINKKIILHCWGSIVNLNASLELASLFKKEILMVEFPITKFELNDFFVMNAKINNSKFYLKNDLKIIENFYDKNLKYKKKEKDKFKFE